MCFNDVNSRATLITSFGRFYFWVKMSQTRCFFSLFLSHCILHMVRWYCGILFCLNDRFLCFSLPSSVFPFFQIINWQISLHFRLCGCLIPNIKWRMIKWFGSLNRIFHFFFLIYSLDSWDYLKLIDSIV